MLAASAVALIASGSVQAARPRGAAPLTPAPQTARSEPSPRALFDQYCVTCHNQRRPAAGLALDAAAPQSVGATSEMWEKVVKKLRSGSMPPPGNPRPNPAAYNAAASWLETEIDRAAAAHPNPGRVRLHRLNRAEYTAAVGDLLSLRTDVQTMLPADEGGYGFDNIADVLSISPALLERYMSAAVKISRLAIGDPALSQVVETYNLPRNAVQTDRISDDLPFGTRGGAALRHHFPLDGEYVLRVRMYRMFNENQIIGLDKHEQLDVRVDGERVKVFTVGGDCEDKATDPKCVNAGGGLGSQYDRTADDGLEVRFAAKAGTRVVGVAFLKTTSAPEGVTPSRLPVTSNSFWSAAYDRAEMAIERVQISGPFNATAPGDTPSRREIFVCRPTGSQDEKACATKILGRLARRAYRRPVSDRDVQTLLGFYETGRNEVGFERGIQFALERLLVAPDFLFRAERDPATVAPGGSYRLSDLELASRLSFFLWSSIPDDELLDVAARGKLKDPAVLEQQVRRMLGDPRATALVKNFGGQWLYLRNMRQVRPDAQAYPEFDDNLREALQRETELFLESQLRADRSVVELLTANYTFLNERLAQHYGIPNVYGTHFRRVAYPDDTRAGLLGQGSVLTVTSYSTRTSPVLRGKWLLENLLGAPPPAPPPNVPPLDENDKAKPTSVRERLEQHRRNPVCASCHSQMDPLGFALENFDGIGQWRTIGEGGAAVDASGILPDGTRFNGPAEFRKALLTHREEFVGTVTERLLTYALGRGVEYFDMPAIRKIQRDAEPAGDRWSSLILGIVKSAPFQMRTTEIRNP